MFTIIALTLCTGLFLIAIWSVDDAVNYEPSMRVGVMNTNVTQADSFLIFDEESGTEIASKNAQEVLPIASVTKLFSASLFYAHADLEATTSITWGDVNTEGDAGRLRPFEVYSYRELMYPLLLESSNDASMAMLRVYPTLLEDMNRYVLDAGFTHTVFADPSGLSSENVSTAYELALLVRKMRKEYEHVFDITRLTQFIGTHTGWMNNNPLFGLEGFKGGKHGFTYEANRTVVVFFDETLASGDVRTIGYVLLGSPDLKTDIVLLREEVRKNVTIE